MSAFVLILLALLVGLVWAVLWGPLKDVPLIPGQAAKSAQESPQAPDKATPPAKVRRGSTSREGSVPAEPAVEAATQSEPPAAATPPAPPQPVKFPTSADVPVGMQGSRIVALFGPPVARTIGVDQSGQVEILIYRRGDPNTATFIHLRNGRVVSASTTLY